jgi:hypothetical protein
MFRPVVSARRCSSWRQSRVSAHLPRRWPLLTVQVRETAQHRRFRDPRSPDHRREPPIASRARLSRRPQPAATLIQHPLRVQQPISLTDRALVDTTPSSTKPAQLLQKLSLDPLGTLMRHARRSRTRWHCPARARKLYRVRIFASHSDRSKYMQRRPPILRRDELPFATPLCGRATLGRSGRYC